MLIVVLISAALTVAMVAVVIRTQGKINRRLDTIAGSLVQLQVDLERPAGAPRLGRTWPSNDELAAARNRIDTAGVAHPGKPN